MVLVYKKHINSTRKQLSQTSSYTNPMSGMMAITSEHYVPESTMAIRVQLPLQPHQNLQVQQALQKPTLQTSVILAAHSLVAQAMCKHLVAHSCAGAHTHTHAPLHARSFSDAHSLLQVCWALLSAYRCLWIPTNWKVWLERSQPRNFC